MIWVCYQNIHVLPEAETWDEHWIRNVDQKNSTNKTTNLGVLNVYYYIYFPIFILLHNLLRFCENYCQSHWNAPFPPSCGRQRSPPWATRSWKRNWHSTLFHKKIPLLKWLYKFVQKSDLFFTLCDFFFFTIMKHASPVP